MDRAAFRAPGTGGPESLCSCSCNNLQNAGATTYIFWSATFYIFIMQQIKMVNPIKLLDNAEVDQVAGFQVKNLKKAQLLLWIKSGIPRSPRSRQTDSLPLSVSDTYETSSLIFTTNKEIADWAEMMGGPWPDHSSAGPDPAARQLFLF